MLLSARTDSLRTFSVRVDGGVVEGEPLPLRDTLFGHAFGAEHAALLRLQIPEGRGIDGMAERLRLVHAVHEGVRGFHVLGAGHGVREGKLYAATPDVLHRVHRYFETAEDALAYGGLLFSESRHVLRLTSARVTTRGDGDGQGWIDADVLREHSLPVRQVQIRALWPGCLAKGTLLPVEGLRSRELVEVLLHESQVKGTGQDVSGAFLLGVRDVAQVRSYRSSWTWTQFLDETLQERLFERYARPALAAVRRAMTSKDSALAFLDSIQVEGEEGAERRDLLTALLAAGLSPRHPWVHRRLLELVRRTYLDASLALGPVPMTAGMAAAAEDDRRCHEVTCNWVPEGVVTLLRYPVRDGMSLRLVRNVHRSGIPEGTVLVHPRLMQELDGDFDGDWVAICQDRDVRRGIKGIHQAQPPRLPIPPRTRKRSPLSSLPRVAVENVGASGIGTPTWYVAASVDKRRFELLPRLSLSLQVATMGLKWSVERDHKLVGDISKSLELPEWLSLQQDREVFATKVARVPDVGLGRFWNLATKAFEEDTLGARGTLSEFLDAVPLPAGDPAVIAEVETHRQAFNRRIAESQGSEEEIEAAIQAVRSWAAGKEGATRMQFGRTAWFLSHRSPSTRNTGSFAIHAFPDVLVEDVARTTGYRAPVLVHAGRSAVPIERVEGRPCVRAEGAPSFAVTVEPRESVCLRLVGGWRALADLYGVTEKDALRHLEETVSHAGPDPAEIRLSWVQAPWNGHMVLRADLGEDPLGFVPEEMASSLPAALPGSHRAMLLVRGKTVWATIAR